MNSIVLTSWTAIALLGTCVAQASQPATTVLGPSHHLTHSQANRLVFTATTPEEHRELADYYRQQADRQRKKEQSYLDTEASYRLHPPRADAYRNSPTAALYRQMADSARQLASAYDQLASYQDKLANDLVSAK